MCDNEWSTVSDAAKHMVRALMTLQPSARLTAQQALAHPWLNTIPNESPSNPSILRQHSAQPASNLIVETPHSPKLLPMSAPSTTPSTSKNRARKFTFTPNKDTPNKEVISRSLTNDDMDEILFVERNITTTPMKLLTVDHETDDDDDLVVSSDKENVNPENLIHEPAEAQEKAVQIDVLSVVVSEQKEISRIDSTEEKKGLFALVIAGSGAGCAPPNFHESVPVQSNINPSTTMYHVVDTENIDGCALRKAGNEISISAQSNLMVAGRSGVKRSRSHLSQTNNNSKHYNIDLKHNKSTLCTEKSKRKSEKGRRQSEKKVEHVKYSWGGREHTGTYEEDIGEFSSDSDSNNNSKKVSSTQVSKTAFQTPNSNSQLLHKSDSLSRTQTRSGATVSVLLQLVPKGDVVANKSSVVPDGQRRAFVLDVPTIDLCETTYSSTTGFSSLAQDVIESHSHSGGDTALGVTNLHRRSSSVVPSSHCTGEESARTTDGGSVKRGGVRVRAGVVSRKQEIKKLRVPVRTLTDLFKPCILSTSSTYDSSTNRLL